MITDGTLHRLGAMSIHQCDLAALADQMAYRICLQHSTSSHSGNCSMNVAAAAAAFGAAVPDHGSKSTEQKVMLIHCTRLSLDSFPSLQACCMVRVMSFTCIAQLMLLQTEHWTWEAPRGYISTTLHWLLLHTSCAVWLPVHEATSSEPTHRA